MKKPIYSGYPVEVPGLKNYVEDTCVCCGALIDKESEVYSEHPMVERDLKVLLCEKCGTEIFRDFLIVAAD